MRTIIWLALIAVAAAVTMHGAEHRVSLTVKPDGSCVIRSDSTQPRVLIEQQLRRQELRKQRAAADEDEPPPPDAAKDPKPYTDEELATKYRGLAEERREQMIQAGEVKLESIDVQSNSVRTVSTHSLPSLEELLKNSHVLWGQSGLTFETLRLEKDTNGHLRVTLTPYTGNPRWVRSLKQQWKMSDANNEMRFVFPGRVLTSGLPNVASNATWVAFDGRKDETLDAALKLYEAPVVITAELGGLPLGAPLDSRSLQRQRAGGGTEPELPITEAGPGFLAEASSVVLTTVHYFPAAQQRQRELQNTLGHQTTGAVVRVKLFAPKGRTLKSVTGARVLQATDDQGRALAVGSDGGDSGRSSVTYASGGRPANWMSIQLQLPLPGPDVQSIESLDAEAIAFTAGDWKELTLPKLEDKATNVVDLASVLEGARLTITKVTRRRNQLTLEGELNGPVAIRQVEILARFGNEERSNSHLSDRGLTSRDKVSTRKFTLQAYHYGSEDDEPAGSPSVVVRYPQDQKRERVKFNLKGLDLF